MRGFYLSKDNACKINSRRRKSLFIKFRASIMYKIWQFMPLAGNNAYVGKTDQVEKIPEYKIEMVCEEQIIQKVIRALKTASISS